MKSDTLANTIPLMFSSAMLHAQRQISLRSFKAAAKAGKEVNAALSDKSIDSIFDDEDSFILERLP